MTVQLKQISSNTEFSIGGKKYKKLSVGGPVFYLDDATGYGWRPWSPAAGVDKSETKQGVAAAPYLGGQYQYSEELACWFPMSQDVEVS